MPKGPYIQTFTGREFYPFDVQPEMIVLEDIAHALSMLCRYCGHCPRFYSVAEHSVLVADLATRLNAQTPDESRRRSLVGRQALLHDASEAYITDLAQPLKHSGSFENYREIEYKIQSAIYQKFLLPAEDLIVVKQADRQLLTAESCHFWGEKAKRWDTYREQDYRMPALYGFPPELAKLAWIEAWKHYGGELL